MQYWPCFVLRPRRDTGVDEKIIFPGEEVASTEKESRSIPTQDTNEGTVAATSTESDSTGTVCIVKKCFVTCMQKRFAMSG